MSEIVAAELWYKGTKGQKPILIKLRRKLARQQKEDTVGTLAACYIQTKEKKDDDGSDSDEPEVNYGQTIIQSNYEERF